MRTLSLYFPTAPRPDALVQASERVLGSVRRASNNVSQRLRQMTFNQQLAMVAATIFMFNAFIAGSWIAGGFERLAVEDAARQLALQVEPVLQSLSSKLANDQSFLKSEPGVLLDHIDAAIAPSGTVEAGLWKMGGSAPAPSAKFLDLHGPAAVEALQAAIKGDVSAVYAGQGRSPSTTAKPEFQIFVPLRASSNDAVLAVAEYHQSAVLLQKMLSKLRWQIGALAALMSLLVFALSLAMSRARQQAQDERDDALGKSLEEKQAFTLQTAAMRQELNSARRRAIELNERFLRRLSSDLHDGPAQHLALALLRLEELTPSAQAERHSKPKDAQPAVVSDRSAVSTIQRAITDALREIRNISSGLALPELQKISPADALGIAARAHERATGTTVGMRLNALPARLPLPLTICLFRFAQEGLNNAFRHAGGKGQQVGAICNSGSIEVEVIDQGPGFDVDQHLRLNERIGLTGLRHRVESLGGTLQICSAPGSGTRLSLSFPYQDGGLRHG